MHRVGTDKACSHLQTILNFIDENMTSSTVTRENGWETLLLKGVRTCLFFPMRVMDKRASRDHTYIPGRHFSNLYISPKHGKKRFV